MDSCKHSFVASRDERGEPCDRCVRCGITWVEHVKGFTITGSARPRREGLPPRSARNER